MGTASDQAILEGSPGDDLDEALERLLDWVAGRGIELYEAQETAILEIFAGRHVILATPTGSGKSLVAQAQHYKAICEGKRSFYTAPIKALASEKFFELCGVFGPEKVGMLTGDAAINSDAPVICCTAEVLANAALRQGANAEIDYVVADEFHYYADAGRGVAWQLPLLLLPQSGFVLISATFGNTRAFEQALERLNKREVAVVRSHERPVPLDYRYSEKPLHETIDDLIRRGHYPAYVVGFTQRDCAELAQALLSANYCTKEEKRALAEALRGVAFDTPYGPTMRRFLGHGVGLHHAGLVPRYRLLVEQLSQRGLLKIVVGTDTLGVGVNVPIRTVVFTRLSKFDGHQMGILTVRDFQQIGGRAGRKGFDEAGSVVVQAPEHVIENRRQEQLLAGNTKKLRRLVRKKPPKGFVAWNEDTFWRLVNSPPEDLNSQFAVDHGMMINVMQGAQEATDAVLQGVPFATEETNGSDVTQGGGYGKLLALIAKSHDSARKQSRHKRRVAQLFRALRRAEVVEIARGSNGRRMPRLRTELRGGFSLMHALSLYAVEVITAFNRDEPTYAEDVLTIIEATLENPRVILMRQFDRLKRERLDELKVNGVPYEQRLEELDKIEYPKPLRDFIYTTFEEFSDAHPWVDCEYIHPKSIAREMFESYASFKDYVVAYGLERSEGVLLRYLSQTYKTLVQTVPESCRTDTLDDIIAFLRSVIAHTDSSLVAEWERMSDVAPDEVEVTVAPVSNMERLYGDHRAFRARLRAEVHGFVGALSRQDYERAAGYLRADSPGPVAAADLERALRPFFAEYLELIGDARARAAHLLLVDERGVDQFGVTQTLLDPAEELLWAATFEVDLAAIEQPDEPMLRLLRIGD